MSHSSKSAFSEARTEKSDELASKLDYNGVRENRIIRSVCNLQAESRKVDVGSPLGKIMK